MKMTTCEIRIHFWASRTSGALALGLILTQIGAPNQARHRSGKTETDQERSKQTQSSRGRRRRSVLNSMHNLEESTRTSIRY